MASTPMRKIPAFAAMFMMGLTTLVDGEEERTRKAMLAIVSGKLRSLPWSRCLGQGRVGR